jgi:hypothetical protein
MKSTNPNKKLKLFKTQNYINKKLNILYHNILNPQNNPKALTL